MNPIPLLFVDHAPGLGGAERSLLLLLKHLDRSRWQPHLACTGGLLAENAAALGIAVYSLPMPRLRHSPRAPVDWLRGVLAIARVARDIGAQVLIANTVRAALYTAPAARVAAAFFVWYMRDFWLSEERPRWLWVDHLGKRWLCGAAARVIANSQAVAANLPCYKKVTVIYNGIEVEQYDPSIDGAPFRQQFGIPFQAPLVGMIGRLRPWKGQDRFLRILAQVREKVPEVWGLVVGGTPLGEEESYPALLRQLAYELGLTEQVVFTGHIEDVRPALAAIDVFVHPGDPEPFGLVNIEAMAMGKPVVTFAHGALPEIVIDGETGVLIPPRDEKAMAEVITELLHAPEWRKSLGQAGCKRVREHFALNRTTAEFMKVLEEIVR